MTDAEAVRILRLAAGGDGVGKLADGRTVFIPRTAPGDLVEIARMRSHRRFARARIGQLLESGPDRVAARCPHYDGDECGGCQLQHVAAERQLEIKRAVVGDALRRIAGLDVPDPEIVPSDIDWGYRNKLSLTVVAQGRRIGLHRFERPDEVFDLARCDITDPALLELWRAVRAHRSLLPSNAERLVLRIDRGGTRHLIVHTSDASAWASPSSLARELMRAGSPAVLWWHPDGGAARTVAGEAEAYPATVFEQVHPGFGDLIRAFAIDQLGSVEDRHVWDLYAGIGDTTDDLLRRGASVESVELDRRAVEFADRRWRTRHGLPIASQAPDHGRVTRHAGRVEDLVEELRAPAQVISNPPRTGMDERVTEAILAQSPSQLVYISCDPATLARDIARLAPAYRLGLVRAFDLFPQTAHVETVAVLEVA
ncbi:MAG: TRAM domain-containing protein [Gemmatimonadota bacterium]